jgi:hypothetical protein
MRRAFSMVQSLGWSLPLLAAGMAVGGCGTKSLDGIDPTPGGDGSALCAENGGLGPDGKSAGGPGLMTPSSVLLDGLVTAVDPPPAISGGTMVVLADKNTVVVGDADRDRVFVVDLVGKKVRWSIALGQHEQPGRLVEDGAGMVHLVLRGSGTLATVDPVAGKVTQRRGVCAAPRGLAYDKVTDRLHVACAGGELVTFASTGATPERTRKLDLDLRDVVVDGPRLLVTRFRSAEIIVLDSEAAMMDRTRPAAFTNVRVHGGTTFSPAVAWRATAVPGGGMVMSHQRGMDGEVGVSPGGYGGFDTCGSIVHTSVTRVKAGEDPVPGPALPGFVLPVDLAVSPDGKRVAVVAAGNGHALDAENTPKLFVTEMDDVTEEWEEGCTPDGKHGPGMCSVNTGTGGATVAPQNPDGSCPAGLVLCQTFCLDPSIACPQGGTGGAGGLGGSTGAGAAGGSGAPMSSDVATGPGTGATSGGTGGSTGGGGQGGASSPNPGSGGATVANCRMRIPVNVEPVSVAFADDTRVVVQTREPAALFIVTPGSAESITLSQESRADTGHILFHANSGGGLACASCHPEGHEDGRVWTFQCEGTRRTQDLGGGLSGTEPFHWNGDLGTFPKLVDTVFVGRMSGPPLTREQTAAALSWVNRVPAHAPLRPPADPVVARGKALFESQAVGCATCHTGPLLTNNTSVDVHTDGKFQVPSLRGVSGRAPFMHDGCAPTLAARFSNTICGGGDAHGKTSQLTPAQLSDLVGYLESL